MRKNKLMTKVFAGMMVTALVLQSTPMAPVSAQAAQKVVIKTQKQLDAALKNKNVTAIEIRTNSGTTFSIKRGDYNKSIVVNSTKAKVVNNGEFKSVTVKNATSFTEKADNNKINVTDKNLNLTVSKGADNSKITVSSTGGKVNVKADGKVATVTVNKKTTLKVSGSTPNAVKITSNATGASINVASKANVQLNKSSVLNVTKGGQIVVVNAKANANVNVAEGAKVTNVNTYGEDAKINVKADGTVAKLNVNKKANVNVKGDTDTAVKVTSKAEDATFVIDAKSDLVLTESANVTVTEGTVIGTLVANKDADIKVAEGAIVEKVEVKGTDAKVNLEANGTVGAVSVDAKADVAVTGTTTSTVKVEANAEGASITTSVKTDVTANANVDVTVEKGAEGSKVTAGKEDVKTNVSNKSDQAVTVTDSKGTETKVEVGESTKPETPTEPETPVVPPVIPGGGGSSSSSISVTATLDKADSVKVGDKVTVTPKASSLEDVVYTYQWKSDGVVVGTEASYEIKATDVGHKIEVTVTTTSEKVTGSKSVTVGVRDKVNAVYAGVAAVGAISVANGTTAEDVIKQLPTQVKINDAGSTNVANATVTWAAPEGYKADTAGSYTFTGTVTLPSGWVQAESGTITVDATVTVMEKGTATYTVKKAIRTHNEDNNGKDTIKQTIANMEAIQVSQNGYNVTITGSLSTLQTFASSNQEQGEGKWIAIAIELDGTESNASNISLGSSSNSLQNIGAPDDFETALGTTAGKRVVVWDIKAENVTSPTTCYIKVADGAVTPITVTFVNTDRAVQRIEAINPVTAGTYGSLSSEDEVKAKLPKEVQVVLSDGTKTPLKVASWTNTDGYTTESPAGSYTFTATLEGKEGITNDKTATVEVTVAQATPIQLAAPATVTAKDLIVDGSTYKITANVAAVDNATKYVVEVVSEEKVVAKGEVTKTGENVEVTLTKEGSGIAPLTAYTVRAYAVGADNYTDSTSTKVNEQITAQPAINLMNDTVLAAYNSWEGHPNNIITGLLETGFELTKTAANDGSISVTAKGIMNYVSGFTGFSTDVEQQKGYYLPLQISIPEEYRNTAVIQVLGGDKELEWNLKNEKILDKNGNNDEVFSILVWLGNKGDTKADNKALTRCGEKSVRTITIDWDGDNAENVIPTVYKVYVNGYDLYFSDINSQ